MTGKKTFIWMAIVLGVALVGCGEPPPTPSKETQTQSDRLHQIIKKTGGDWNQLTPEDKSYLVNDLAKGNEGTARMLLGPPQKGPAAHPGQK